MTLEEKLLKILDKAENFRRKQEQDYEGRFTESIEALREALMSSGSCTHRKTTTYRWEWDNGYGRQEWRTGLRCELCYKINSWPNSSRNWH